jgi:hypothetical protein
MGSPPEPSSIFTRSNQSNQQPNNPKNLIHTKPHTNQSSCALVCVALFSLSCPALPCPLLCCSALPCPLCPALPLPCPCCVSRPLPIIYFLTYLSCPLPIISCLTSYPLPCLSAPSLTYRAIRISVYPYSSLLPPSCVPSLPSLPILSCHAGMVG